jgi:serine/threonine protein kinase
MSITGQTFLHYSILEKIGEGGMGAVYKAQDTHLDRIVAVKVLPHEKLSDPERRQRFVQEAKAASSLNHPNIIVVHDITSDHGLDFMVMEYVEGKTLDQLIGRKGMKLKDTLACAKTPSAGGRTCLTSKSCFRTCWWAAPVTGGPAVRTLDQFRPGKTGRTRGHLCCPAY